MLALQTNGEDIELAKEYVDKLHPDTGSGFVCPRGYLLIEKSVCTGFSHESEYELVGEESKWSGSVGDFGVDGSKQWIKNHLGQILESASKQCHRSAAIEQVSLNSFREIDDCSNGKADQTTGLRNILLDFDSQESETEIQKLLQFLERVQIPHSFAVSSGKKGVHVVICLDAILSDTSHADSLCNAIYEILHKAGAESLGMDAGTLAGGRKFTSACRIPSLLRRETGNLQKLLVSWRGYVSLAQLELWITRNLPNWQTRTRWKINQKDSKSDSFPKEDKPSPRELAYVAMKTFVEEKDWIFAENHFWAWDGKSHYCKLDWNKDDPRSALWNCYKVVVGNDVSERQFTDLFKCLKLERSQKLGHHPHLLNLANGILNLNTFQLSPNSKEYRFNYVIDVEFEPLLMANPPHSIAWESILLGHVVTEDRELLEGYLGYAMTDDRSKPQMIVFYGASDTGKSKVLEFHKRLLGNELTALESVTSVLHDMAIASNLIGKRASYASESKIKMEDLERFKALVSFEAMTCHVFFERKFTTTPETKFLCSTNNEGWLPNHKEILKRIRVVTFINPIPLHEQDAALADKVWNDRKIIFHRLLAAYLRVKNQTAFAVNTSTLQYLQVASENINPIAAWINDEGLASGEHWYPVEFLHALYQKQTNDERMTLNEFGKKLSDANIRYQGHNGDRQTYRFQGQNRTSRGRFINRRYDKEYAEWSGYDPAWTKLVNGQQRSA